MFTSKKWRLNNSLRQGEGRVLTARANRLKPIALQFPASKPFISISAAAVFWCSVSIGNAATLTWSGVISRNDWFDAGNWNQNVVPPRPPMAGDSIYIGTNTAGAAANGIVTIGPGSTAGSNLYLGYARLIRRVT